MTVSHTIHGSIPHIFSHINMTYHIHHLVLGPTSAMGTRDRPVPRDGAVWLDASQVEAANVGTGVEKVWAEVFGSWGSFKVGAMKNGGKGKAGTVGKGKAGSGAKVDKKGPDVRAEGKVVKKVMMPLMPSKV
jgi:A/G-specific adenine glycosylase